MGERRFLRLARHPVFALVWAVLFGLVALALSREGITARNRLAAADDPVRISDQALDRSFNREVAEREIAAALASGDIDLAQSFVALAVDRGVPIDPALAAKVKDAGVKQSSVGNTAGRFVHGLWSGEPTDLASLAGTAVGDLFVFGDIRDAAREGTHYLMGQHYDPWIFGLAGVGIAITAATYATAGITAPERVGLSLVKAARRSGRLNPVLAVRAAREAIVLARNNSVLGRAAIVLTATTFDLAMWLIWAAFAALGFCASCKTAVERMTQRLLLRSKARRLRAAELQMLALPARP